MKRLDPQALEGTIQTTAYWIVREAWRPEVETAPFGCSARCEEEAIGLWIAERGISVEWDLEAERVSREEALEAVVQEVLSIPNRNREGVTLPRSPDGAFPMIARMQRLMRARGSDEDGAGHRDDNDGWGRGERAWFETRASTPEWDGASGNLTRRSQQPVTLLGVMTLGQGADFATRAASGRSTLYRVLFEDGFEATVFEDELVTDRAFFTEDGRQKDQIGGGRPYKDGQATYPVPLEPFTAGVEGWITDAYGWPVAQATRGVWSPAMEAAIARGIADRMLGIVYEASALARLANARTAGEA